MEEKRWGSRVPSGNGHFLPRPPIRRRMLTFLVLSIVLFCATKLIPTARLYRLGPENGALTKSPDSDADEGSAKATANKTKVELEAHIMSKCPDAKDCLKELVVPAMEQAAEMVDFRLSFIGELVKCPSEVSVLTGL